MSAYRNTLFVLFALFVVATTVYLHRVPGLMGDEASEGENVFELLESETIVVTGERSYIGPAIDYIRVPFIWVFGYSALALRLVIWLFSLATFWLAWSVLQRMFGQWPGLFALGAMSFSPIYLTYQRLSWTITLFPFFALLMIWLWQRKWRGKWVVAGLAAGLGLANHIIFLPTLVGVAVGAVVYWALGLLSPAYARSKIVGQVWSAVWQGVIGFWAGFGMQFVVLALKRDDQGDPGQVAQLFTERLSDLSSVLPLVMSGSAFMARYTGVEMSSLAITLVVGTLTILMLLAIIFNYRRRYLWAVIVGLLVHLMALTYVTDRFTLRYFVVISLGVWLLAGLGLGSLVEKLIPSRDILKAFIVSVLVLILGGWFVGSVIVPHVRTGGSTEDFSLGNRTNSAAALVDARELIECVRGGLSVHSENIHIWNRLQFLSHRYDDLNVLPEEGGGDADLVVHYRWPVNSDQKQDCPTDRSSEVCADLEHFCVVAN